MRKTIAPEETEMIEETENNFFQNLLILRAI